MTAAPEMPMSARHPAVVVGYDFSHTGEAALERAVHLAGRAPEHVLHVLCAIDSRHGLPSIPVDEGVDHRYVARVQEALSMCVLQACERTGASAPFTFYVHGRIGSSGDRILELAEEVGAALIVVGSHGLTGLERVLLGSTSERIVREAKCTVEVARPQTYPDVERAPVVAPHLPPHRYEYADKRVMLVGASVTE